MAIGCAHDILFHSALSEAQRCAVAASDCADQQQVINFYRLYFCHLNSPWLAVLLIALVLFFLFRFIYQVANNYVTPSLIFIAQELGLSDALAGATLLAFANGLSDVATAYSASNTAEGVSYIIGILFGAGLFCLTVLVTLIIRASPAEVVVERERLFRDLGFYCLATVLLLVSAATGVVGTAKALAFFLLYVLFVAVVLLSDAQRKRTLATPSKEKFQEEEQNLLLEGRLKSQPRPTRRSTRKSSWAAEPMTAFAGAAVLRDSQVVLEPLGELRESIADLPRDSEVPEEYQSVPRRQTAKSFVEDEEKALVESRISSITRVSKFDKVLFIRMTMTDSNTRDLFMRFVQRLNSTEQTVVRKQQNLLITIAEVLDTPFRLVRVATLLPSSGRKIEAHLFILWPFVGIPVILWAVDGNPRVEWLFYIPWAMILSTLFALSVTSKSNIILAPSFMFLINLISTLTGVLWAKIIAGILLDLVAFLGTLSTLNTTFLAVTVIGVGNSLADVFNLTSVSARGFAAVALTSAYSGQTFSLLFGFGIAMLNRIFRTGRAIDFRLFDPALVHRHAICIVLLAFSLFTMVFTVVWVSAKKGVFGTSLGMILTAIYVVFISTCVWCVLSGFQI